MLPLNRSVVPNVITLGRIALTPLIFYLPLIPRSGPRLAAFLLFAVAAISDLWDGYLARKHGWISDFGKLIDPLADKLLMAATLIPLYLISNPSAPLTRWPLWESLPLWAVVVIVLREVVITAIRTVAARRGEVLPASTTGKWKAFSLNIFLGTGLLWYALHALAAESGWTGTFWELWLGFHGAVLALSLAVALILTVVSLCVYLWNWRRVVVYGGG